jgi:hypothetical protein
MGRDNWGESGAAAARCNTADNKRTSGGGLQAAKASIFDAPRGVGVESLTCRLPLSCRTTNTNTPLLDALAGQTWQIVHQAATMKLRVHNKNERE